MAKKKNPLVEGLENKQNGGDSAAIKAAARVDRVLVAGHFATEVQRELKIIAAKESTTIQAHNETYLQREGIVSMNWAEVAVIVAGYSTSVFEGSRNCRPCYQS